MNWGDGSVSKVMTRSESQHQHKKLNVVMCASNPNTGVVETDGFLKLTG